MFSLVGQWALVTRFGPMALQPIIVFGLVRVFELQLALKIRGPIQPLGVF